MIFRIIELKILEPVLFWLRPFFASEEAYYEKVMSVRTKLRRLFGKAPTNDVHSSLDRFSYYETFIQPSAKVIEYGCGSCGLGYHLFKHLESNSYVGCDISKAALSVGLEKLKVDIDFLNKKPRLLHFKTLEELEEKLDQEKFDYIVLNSVFTHISPNKILECLVFFKKILKREGKVIGDFSLPLNKDSFNRKEIDFYYSEKDIILFAAKSGLSLNKRVDFPPYKTTTYESVMMEFSVKNTDS